MDSDFQPQQYHHHFQGQFQLPKQQVNSSGGGGGLTRYRSAPSSYFSALTDPAGVVAGPVELPLPKPLSPDTEAFLARFVQSVTDAGEGGFGIDSPAMQPDFPVAVKQETDQQFPISNTESHDSHQTIYHSSNKPPLARRSSNSIGGSRCGMESNFRLPSTNFLPSPMKMETGLRPNASTLTRHRSSPVGLFDDIIIENGYLVNRGSGTENYGSSNKSISNQEFSSPASKLNDEMNVSSGTTDVVDPNFISSWDDSSMFSDQFSLPESGVGELNNPENHQEEKEESRKRPLGLLAHHLSLPQASLEKLMQLQDTVPCQLRAKRGCATHPRSIAERVRRTKISERMRKLQDLVPNMDKQTNTADMLDFAADYIKDLQRQVQTLSHKRARCTCS